MVRVRSRWRDGGSHAAIQLEIRDANKQYFVSVGGGE